MRLLFCDSGFSRKEVDYLYQEEFQSAKKQLLPTSLISFEELKKGNTESALRTVRPADAPEMGIYRGWMLKPQTYRLLYDALQEKNIRLINTPEEYKFCHYLPESYELIKGFTPQTVSFKVAPKTHIDQIPLEALQVFGSQAIIVKDYVKSQKHYWKEACFIPDASDSNRVKAITQKFLELQDEDLNEGLVFREFVDLEELTNHSQSGMPLTKEFRLFILNHKIISIYKYWDEGDYQNLMPTIESFKDLIHTIKSNFFTMDIAKSKGGDWIIIELGDGQVSGLPDNADKDAFFESIKSFA